jgi:hypothetical protein
MGMAADEGQAERQGPARNFLTQIVRTLLEGVA